MIHLKAIAPSFTGEDFYKNTMAVTDQNVIPANGVGPIEFAHEIFNKCGVFGETTTEKWFQLFKNGVWSA